MLVLALACLAALQCSGAFSTGPALRRRRPLTRAFKKKQRPTEDVDWYGLGGGPADGSEALSTDAEIEIALQTDFGDAIVRDYGAGPDRVRYEAGSRFATPGVSYSSGVDTFPGVSDELEFPSEAEIADMLEAAPQPAAPAVVSTPGVPPELEYSPDGLAGLSYEAPSLADLDPAAPGWVCSVPANVAPILRCSLQSRGVQFAANIVDLAPSADCNPRGRALEELAAAKARHLHAVTGRPSVAEATGFEVEAATGSSRAASGYRLNSAEDQAERLLAQLLPLSASERECTYR